MKFSKEKKASVCNKELIYTYGIISLKYEYTLTTYISKTGVLGDGVRWLTKTKFISSEELYLVPVLTGTDYLIALIIKHFVKIQTNIII